LKNGFSDVFSLRLDLPLLQRAMAESVGLANGVRAYRPARIIDLEPGETLGFDTALFLPGNNRYVRLSAAGDPLDEEMVLRLRQRGVRSLHVPLDQMRAYRDYTASRLKKLASAGAAPADSEKRVAAVRDLIAGLVYERETEDSIGSGRAVMGQATEIVADYIKGSPSGSIYDKILELSDEGNAGYSHSVNVSTVAALFALGTGLANPEHMALAGLLHDTGASAEDEQLEGLDESQLSAEQRAGLHFGPIRTLELIKKRKLILPTQVSQAIADHHERHDGRGYPEGKIGPRISTEAVLLALADDLDRVTQPVAGRPRKTVQDWVKLRRQAMSAGVGRCEFNPAIVAKVLELFP
jgi:HD-GYP domain-containing protein (c-di-GMP phosphodiesterase class II)